MEHVSRAELCDASPYNKRWELMRFSVATNVMYAARLYHRHHGVWPTRSCALRVAGYSYLSEQALRVTNEAAQAGLVDIKHERKRRHVLSLRISDTTTLGSMLRDYLPFSAAAPESGSLSFLPLSEAFFASLWGQLIAFLDGVTLDALSEASGYHDAMLQNVITFSPAALAAKPPISLRIDGDSASAVTRLGFLPGTVNSVFSAGAPVPHPTGDGGHVFPTRFGSDGRSVSYNPSKTIHSKADDDDD